MAFTVVEALAELQSRGQELLRALEQVPTVHDRRAARSGRRQEAHETRRMATVPRERPLGISNLGQNLQTHMGNADPLQTEIRDLLKRIADLTAKMAQRAGRGSDCPATYVPGLNS